MNKKFLGIKIGTILAALGCVVIAFVIWVIAKYNINFPSDTDVGASSAFDILGRLL